MKVILIFSSNSQQQIRQEYLYVLYYVFICISYIGRWTAAPCGSGHPAAGLSIFAAGLFITRDVSELGLMLRQIQRCQRDGLQLQRERRQELEAMLQVWPCGQHTAWNHRLLKVSENYIPYFTWANTDGANAVLTVRLILSCQSDTHTHTVLTFSAWTLVVAGSFVYHGITTSPLMHEVWCSLHL